MKLPFWKKTSPTNVDDEDAADLARYRAGMPSERPPVGQLPPQDWLQWPETQAVITALQASGQQVRFVGGCVRDALCGRAVHDIDIATPDGPETVMGLLERAGIRAIPTGIAHGTVTAVLGGRHFEITTLREDVACDGRHATVAWTRDWMMDAARRDFTINALSASPDGAVYDYFDGIPHLAHGRVRFIGRPDDRIAEDYLRILRYFRFYARYGAGAPNRAALAACRAAAPHMVELSGERVQGEILKILATPLAADVVALMIGEKILDALLPELRDVGRLRQVIFLETRGLQLDGIRPDPLRRLAAALPSGPAAVETIEAVTRRLRMSRADAARVLAISQVQATPAFDASPQEHWRALRRSGGPLAVDRLLLAWAQWRAQEGRVSSRVTEGYRRCLEQALSWQPVPFPLAGRDLLALGIPAGPALGAVLREVEVWWEERDGVPDGPALQAEALRRWQGIPAIM
ncbi:CCA tRNA nucleotidyltransferase [Insolitispirillum peregrinum]|uniref:Poly(A) polymerase n=1 Tax=Insolitispirillum peregrinum TaxID=80876 RepID=A0A1N7PZW8_9PROT|nr:CCA tRNA nucleotidyltransferase [Insolitispirillum peregrinum]SIT16136.1 poly(A) polymerase [Insolitispirillum peregrinum]